MFHIQIHTKLAKKRPDIGYPNKLNKIHHRFDTNVQKIRVKQHRVLKMYGNATPSYQKEEISKNEN